MFQNQNEYQKDFANYWYTERAKNPKYSDQIGGDKLNSVLSNVNKATWKTPTEAMRDNMVGQGYNPTDAQINQQLNILKEKGTKGFANPKAHSYTSLRPTNTWHEGIGHMVGDKHDDYFLLPTEQKAHMNQLREWMFQNGYINRRDQKVTPEYMSKIMKQLNNVEGMKGVQRAAQQFKSNKTFTKWFNSVPLIGAGLLGVNKYFTDEDKQEK